MQRKDTRNHPVRRPQVPVAMALGLLASLSLGSHDAWAVVTTFLGDLPGFNAAAGSPPISIEFDSIAPGTNIAGSTISGITFSSPPGNSLEVVTAASTVNPGPDGDSDNRLVATSGANVLSPGGTSLTQVTGALGQKDSLRLVFSTPVKAFGIDLLFQSLDGVSFLGFEVRDPSNVVIASNSFISIPTAPNGPDPTSGAPAGAPFFVGFVSDAVNIARIDFNETDEGFGNPDSNMGYDTLRFVAPVGVPEPAALLLLGSGLATLAGIALQRRLP